MGDNSNDSSLETARQVIAKEIACLQELKDSLDHQFSAAIELILNSRGRLIVTGIGKSAIVAQKIVATCNSTGTPAIYMHAADAVHGDLGIIQPADIVLALSNSGETAEIKYLLPFIRKQGTKIIGVTSGRYSTLATGADITILLPAHAEADPNNLAPTTSTTAQMALGDALAVALLQFRGFTGDDFARFHPGGNLGKKLYMTVADAMHVGAKPAVQPDAAISEVIISISGGRLGATAVLNEGKIAGIITDGDLRRMLQHRSDLQLISAADIMSHQPYTIHSTALAMEARALMQDHNITQLIVTKEGDYHGIIHLHDLMKEGLI